jgi:hypothetical protein
MTKKEFLEKLKEQREVDFVGSIVSAYPNEITSTVVDSLDTILPAKEIVVDGVQTSVLAGVEGRLGWLLVLSSNVLEMNVRVRDEIYHATYEFHRKEHVGSNIELGYSVVRPRFDTPQRMLTQAKLSLTMHGGARSIVIQSNKDLKPEALCRFMNSIRS